MTNINTTDNIPLPVNAEAFVTIAPNGLEASIRITPPANNGSTLKYEMLKIFLAKNRVIFGIDEGTLRRLGDNPIYNTDFVIARGVLPENGVDARLIYHIDTDRQLRPKEKEDGSVDFKDLGTIQEIKQGQLLCEKIAATPGIPGTDVRGASLPAVAGKDISLPEGQNTVLSGDKLQLHAAVDGHVTILGNKINILNTFTVNGNVSIETGNIDFSGNVVVRGDVAHGFAIKADGDITIEGVAEAAHITAGGTLVIRGGFLGGEDGVLDISGNAFCRFIEGGTVNVKGDLETTYIMNATIKCGGAAKLTGKGLIRGGHISARTSVTANFIGSPKASSASTVIEIGNDHSVKEQFEKVSREAETTAKNIAGLEAMIVPMEKAKASGYLTLDKSKQLEQAKTVLETLKETLEAMKETLETLETQISNFGRGTINIRKTAYAGLKIIIGEETLILQTEYDRVSFYNSPDGITFVPLIEN